MVGKVLTGNGITAYGNGAYSLIGGDELSNLQALCFRCNAGKRDGCLPTQEGAPTSAVCRPATATAKRAVCSARWRQAAGCCWRTHSKLCIADAYPVSEGHSLVIPRRHGADGLELHQPEWNAVVELLKLRREQLRAQEATIRGWNVGLNSGEAAGQTVLHAHWHLIPRRTGDDDSPRGGVRGVIKGKQHY